MCVCVCKERAYHLSQRINVSFCAVADSYSTWLLYVNFSLNRNATFIMESSEKIHWNPKKLSCFNCTLDSCKTNNKKKSLLWAQRLNSWFCVFTAFSVSVINRRVYPVYKIYLFSLYAYIHYYFCTNMDKWVYFFPQRVLLSWRPSPTPFCMICLKLVCPTLFSLLLLLRLQHCSFVILTCQL